MDVLENEPPIQAEDDPCKPRGFLRQILNTETAAGILSIRCGFRCVTLK